MLFKTLFTLLIVSVLWVVAYRYLAVPYTPLMGIRTYQGDANFELRHEWVPLEDISEAFQMAVICAEDQNFFHHGGFDYEAIQKAYSNNKKGKSLKGASTISQQTAKNVFLWPERSWLRKGLEAYFTFLIETLWPKDRILEVYLNSIEMGDGVFGAEAAAQYWYRKSAKRINRHEAASIAIVLPNPRKYRPTSRGSYLENRKLWVLRQMNNFGNLKGLKELKPKL